MSMRTRITKAFFLRISLKREKRKKKELTERCELEAFAKSYDWWEMTEQDEDVWNRIFEFLEK